MSVEPLRWMNGGTLAEERAGPISCYGCGTKIGVFSWEAITCSSCSVKLPCAFLISLQSLRYVPPVSLLSSLTSIQSRPHIFYGKTVNLKSSANKRTPGKVPKSDRTVTRVPATCYEVGSILRPPPSYDFYTDIPPLIGIAQGVSETPATSEDHCLPSKLALVGGEASVFVLAACSPSLS